MTARERTQAELLVVAEVTLAGMSVASLLSVRRVFTSSSFLAPTIAAVLLAHLVAVILRRWKVPHVPALLLTLVGAALFVTTVRLHATAWGGVVPTADTLSTAREQIREALDVFRQVTPPAPVLPGFVVIATASAWIVAFAADSAAFRAKAQLEAVIPATTLFVFGGALGRGGNRLGVAALFIGAALLHWLSQRSLAATRAPAWLAGARGTGVPSLFRVGGALVLAGVLAAVVVGPHLPGAEAKAIIPWRASDRKSPDPRVTVSPLVDIKTKLVDQANIIVFRVKATERAYWRLTSLEHFDGRQWTSSRQYEPAIGTLGTDVDTSDERVHTMQAHFDITALGDIWLPAPFRPVKVSGTDARYDTDSNTLLTESHDAIGATYTVRSAVPTVTAAQLEGVKAEAPRSIVSEYLALPEGFSARVQREAGRVTRGATTQYERALALQNYFRGGSFTYDLNVGPGHDQDALERFLFVTRRGYCEQFAGAYAAMARAIGLPARVAVGFTPGEVDRKTGEYVVRGLNGHAWPEVYLEGFGWVPFEPTPGRGIPGAQGYTNVPEAQAAAADPSTATTAPAATPAPSASPTTTTTTTAPPASPSTARPPTTSHGSRWLARVILALAVLTIAPLLWIAALVVVRRWRRRRRRKGATTPSARILVAWDEVAEALARAGAPPNPWETPNEFASRAAGATGVDRRLLAGLAGVTTRVIYGPGAVTEALAEQTLTVAETVEDAADALVDRRQRLLRLVDPRPVLGERRVRVDVRQR